MYNYVWITGALGLVCTILAIFFLVKDLSFCEKKKQKKATYLLLNWGMFISATAWIFLSVSLFVVLQQQLGK